MRAVGQNLAFLFLLSLSFFSSVFAANVLAIDYGADWIKASLMKPGLPFDVLLNKDSKRKIQSSVAWKNGERLFGSDAFNLATRFPQDTFNSLKYLLGVPGNAESASPKPGGKTWDVEELVAHQLAYVKQLAQDAAGEPVVDAVLTVPAYFSQFERDALADAVELAGLRLITLVHDGTAVAVNYAMTRTFPEPERHIVFDAGASGTRATVVTFSGSSKSKGGAVAVNGIGFARLVGGTELDRRLREILVKKFTEKHHKDIRGDKKAMAKLWKEAGRVKTILSANAEAVATIESLTEDIDFKTKVSRTEFENVCSDLKDQFVAPIHKALAQAGVKLEDIKSVILTGGASRTPMVQAALKAAVGQEKIAQNVNADEAAVLGAALHGASLSRQFRTKDIKVTDLTPYDVQMSYLAEAKLESSTRPRTITSTAFAAGSKLGTKKTLTFKRKDDFYVAFQYKDSVAPEFPVELLDAKISGVKEAFANLTEMGGIDPVVKATIVLSESGFISVPEAVAYAELKDDSITGKLKSFFAEGSSSLSGAADSAQTAEATPAAKKAAATPKEATIPLNVTIKFTSVAPMSLDDKRDARQRILRAEIDESRRAQREEAHNNLEGYLYRLRDTLAGDATHPFVKCSQQSERVALAAKLEQVTAWFHDHAESADLAALQEKLESLQALERPIVHRYMEIEEFPRALNNSQLWNWQTRLFLTEAKTNLTQEESTGVEGRYTRAELDSLEKTLKEHELWLNEWVEKQKSVKMNEDPVIETAEMKKRAEKLEKQLQGLVFKKAPKVKKTSATSSTGSATSKSRPSAGSTKGQEHDEL
ncbi:hypothetical protein EVG20_g6959 [Dentipellis fragilis]|uniref:Actin-like ATPase domain-containing protein n=1 Tax=Dentipellis fragilis TaxID=205917 RepID=A0A4Y9YJ30_9AGAM|nr:hypothetical protein EVG20_g6959 [Dentipellis fragilis]